MSLQQQWDQALELAEQTGQNHVFWTEYYELERLAYAKILSAKQTQYSGTAGELAAGFGLDPTLFWGFCDGINTSLTQEQTLEDMTEETPISLDIVWEKLYYNMHGARAEWLYNLPEWEGVLDAARRKEILQQWRGDNIAKAVAKPGRNEPCPCGSGRKYKHCCG